MFKGHLKMLRDDMWNQFNTATFSNIKAFDQRQSNCAGLNFADHLSSQTLDKLMWDYKNQNISIFGSFDNIGNGNLWMDK